LNPHNPTVDLETRAVVVVVVVVQVLSAMRLPSASERTRWPLLPSFVRATGPIRTMEAAERRFFCGKGLVHPPAAGICLHKREPRNTCEKKPLEKLLTAMQDVLGGHKGKHRQQTETTKNSYHSRWRLMPLSWKRMRMRNPHATRAHWHI
jgi:hypothetical protein